MKKLKSKVKISFSILTLLAISFSFLAFNDSGNYMIRGNVIIKGFENMYEVGKINVKFKSEVTGFTKNSFRIQAVDNVLSEFNVKELVQLHPLKNDISKRKIGGVHCNIWLSKN